MLQVEDIRPKGIRACTFAFGIRSKNIRGSATFASGIRCFATLVATPHSCVPHSISEAPASPHPSTPTTQ